MSAKSETRIHRLQAILKEKSLDGFLCATCSDMVWLLDAAAQIPYQHSSCIWLEKLDGERGDISYQNFPEALLWIPAEGEAHLFALPYLVKRYSGYGAKVTPAYFDRFAYALRELIKDGKIAVGQACHDALHYLLNLAGHFTAADGSHLCDELRCIKDAEEIAALRYNAEMNDLAMEQILPLLQPGKCCADIENALAEFGLTHGAFDQSFSNTVIAQPYGQKRLGKFEPFPKQTVIAFDYGFLFDGYSGDFGRSFMIGKAPQRLRDAYTALKNAHEYLIKTARPGVINVNEINRIIRKGAEGYGIDEWIGPAEDQLMGHQIGIDCHEYPWLTNHFDHFILPGMVFAVEPRINIPDQFYLRMEDVLLMTAAGLEPLTKFTKELLEL